MDASPRKTSSLGNVFGWLSPQAIPHAKCKLRNGDVHISPVHFRAQQELLEARRTGSQIKEANSRRKKVQVTLGLSLLSFLYCRFSYGFGTYISSMPLLISLMATAMLYLKETLAERKAARLAEKDSLAKVITDCVHRTWCISRDNEYLSLS